MESHIPKWGRLIGVDAKESCDLAGLFQSFRPDGFGLEAVFDGIEFGDEVLARVRRCYGASSKAEVRPYFVPTPATTCPHDVALEFARQHLGRMTYIAKHMGDVDLTNAIDDAKIVAVDSELDLNEFPLDDDSPEAWLFDVLTDFMCTLTPHDSPILLLRDAMYAIANDAYVRNHLAWPLYAESSPVVEPFMPYFELWTRGVALTIRRPRVCHFWRR